MIVRFGATAGLASPVPPSWNQVADWLRDMDFLRAAMGGVGA